MKDRKRHAAVAMVLLQLLFARRCSSSRAILSSSGTSSLAFIARQHKISQALTKTASTKGIFSSQETAATRWASTSAAVLDGDIDEEDPVPPQIPELLRPEQLCNGTIPYPKALSPSAIMEFKKCPQSFLFQYLYGLKQPTSLALAKGSMCHAALEKVFDLDPQDRTLEHLQNLFRSEWSRHRQSDTYRILFEKEGSTPDWDLEAEREWGKSGLELLKNYYQIEDPRKVVRPNPVKREIWLNAHLSIDPSQGVTAHGATSQEPNDDVPTFHVRGIVDRLDMVRTRDSDSQASLRIVDYKTGKAPNLKYSSSMNDKIVSEAFFQLKIYALLLREKGAGKQMELSSNKMNLRLLRLLYLNSVSGTAVNWDMDMGVSEEERDALLQEVHQDLSKVWMDIVELVSTQDPKAFVGCDRSFCYCHKCREKFVPGTLWEPS